MPQIHQVETFEHSAHVLDPQHGMVLRKEQVLRRGTANAIFNDDDTYPISFRGTFDVPEDVAELLTKQPGWAFGPNPYQDEFEAEAAKKKTASK